jgi:hypothetical protein
MHNARKRRITINYDLLVSYRKYSKSDVYVADPDRYSKSGDPVKTTDLSAESVYCSLIREGAGCEGEARREPRVILDGRLWDSAGNIPAATTGGRVGSAGDSPRIGAGVAIRLFV